MPDKPPQPQPDPNAWDRFEKAVDAALHTPAPHKPSMPAEKRDAQGSKSK